MYAEVLTIFTAQSNYSNSQESKASAASRTFAPVAKPEHLVTNTSNQIMIPCGRQLQDRRSMSKPNPSCDEIQKCPRCDSSNTKFCYYNNYSLAQPRHFCKACKRYWTKGGALRNVPVGGGCRKNKRSKQRSVDQAAPTHSTPASGEETTSLLSSIRCDRPSNGAGSTLQKEFSVAASSSHGFFVGSDGIEATTGLAFERLDQGAESFPGNSLPLSINWAAGQASVDQTTLHLQPFDHQSTILGLNLAGHHVKQESTGLQNADLSSIFDPQLNMIGRTQPPLAADTLGLHYNLCMDSYGMAPSTGDLQWRFPPPRLVTMMEGGQGYCPNSRSANQGAAIESMRSDQSIRSIMRSKSALEENMPVSATLIASTQEADRLPCEWPSNPVEGFFGDSGDGNSPYWSNGSWPQDDIYEDDQLG